MSNAFFTVTTKQFFEHEKTVFVFKAQTNEPIICIVKQKQLQGVGFFFTSKHHFQNESQPILHTLCVFSPIIICLKSLWNLTRHLLLELVSYYIYPFPRTQDTLGGLWSFVSMRSLIYPRRNVFVHPCKTRALRRIDKRVATFCFVALFSR